MRNADLYKGISPEKQAEYEAWLIEKLRRRHAGADRLASKKYEALSDAEKVAQQDELIEVETAWADAMKNGVPADSKALDPLLKRHRAWVATMWDKPCPPGAYHGLADLHLGHPDFVAATRPSRPAFPTTTRSP